MKIMNLDTKYMSICLQLAKQGIGKVSPNPMVGCVIVKNNEIIAQGFHEYFGGPHAEANAIKNIKNKALLKGSTLYVNLEPCSHYGKTPPCADLIIKHQFAKVVIGCIDTFSEVSGKGIKKLEEAGIEVVMGVFQRKSEEINKRFFTFHNKNRPYIILKWAQTNDGYIDIDRTSDSSATKKDNWITSPESKKLVHHWRSEEQAIMVGTNTALNDNPQLNVRETVGNNPLRIVLDLNLRLPNHLNLFDKTVPTIVFNHQKNEAFNNLEFVQLDKNKEITSQILAELYQREIQSVIIEGGAQFLNTFISENLWDEARVFTAEKEFKTGLKAPKIDKTPKSTMQIETDSLSYFFND